MFTWICPKCGREVPPSYTECPDCAAAAKAGATPAQPAASAPDSAPSPPAAPSQTAAAEPPPVQPSGSTLFGAPAAPQVQVRPYAAPPAAPAARASLPTWLMTIVFALAFLGLGAAIYWTVGYFRGRGTPTPSVNVESPAAKPGAKVNPVQKYVEISGVRFTLDPKKKKMVRFVVTNHSGADLSGLAGNVTVWGRTQKSEEEAAGTFTFSTNLGPYESKDLTVPLNTKLEMIELPDWQNVSTDVQITSPAYGGSQ